MYKTKQKEEITVAYVGPTIENVVLTGATFRGGYPPKVCAAIEKRPYLANLMVPVNALAEARKKARDPESDLGALCRMAKKEEK